MGVGESRRRKLIIFIATQKGTPNKMGMKESLDRLCERFDYEEKHGHDKVPIASPLYAFHNYEHGYQHCEGGKINPYQIKHLDDGKHGIDKEYARGHIKERKPQWFHFSRKIEKGWWDIESGREVDISKVPKEYKSLSEVSQVTGYQSDMPDELRDIAGYRGYLGEEEIEKAEEEIFQEIVNID